MFRNHSLDFYRLQNQIILVLSPQKSSKKTEINGGQTSKGILIFPEWILWIDFTGQAKVNDNTAIYGSIPPQQDIVSC